MRVIAGRFGGRRLAAPRGAATRPTADRVREALFSMLGPLDGASVLDLFAGTGALGIEALSRGAARAVFVERDRLALAALRANLAALGLGAGAGGPQVQVRARDAVAALGEAIDDGEAYDLVFVDPPYAQAGEWGARLAQELPRVLASGGRVVLESDRRAPLALGLPVRRQRRYGDTSITIHSGDET
jgi:16S rRNA (guanine(966)-N(2))-methyltransferase RsmD